MNDIYEIYLIPVIYCCCSTCMNCTFTVKIYLKTVLHFTFIIYKHIFSLRVFLRKVFQNFTNGLTFGINGFLTIKIRPENTRYLNFDIHIFSSK